MKTVIVIQARCGSTRFPGKVLKDILGKPLLYRMYERVSQTNIPCDIVIATSDNKQDDVLEDFCRANNIACFRGNELDLLDRHYQCALHYAADAVVKIPSDCPLIDPAVIDKVLTAFASGRYDFVSNLHPASYPDGNDVEVMSMQALQKAWEEAKKPLEREHTTPYFWENPQVFKIGNVLWETGQDYSMSHRFTIDYEEDYLFIKKVYEELYPSNPHFTLEDILALCKQREDIYQINAKYAGVNWYRNHLDELKTVDHSQTKLI